MGPLALERLDLLRTPRATTRRTVRTLPALVGRQGIRLSQRHHRRQCGQQHMPHHPHLAAPNPTEMATAAICDGSNHAYPCGWPLSLSTVALSGMSSRGLQPKSLVVTRCAPAWPMVGGCTGCCRLLDEKYMR